MDLIQVKDNALCDPLADAYPQPMCDSATGTTFIRWFGTLNGVPNGTHVDTTLAGAAYTVGDESLVTYGECIPDCAPVCPTGVSTTWSTVCPEPPCVTQTACYQVCTTTSTTPVYYEYNLYGTDQAWSQFKNLTYTTGNSVDGQYEISIVNGRWTPLLNLPIDPAVADYGVLTTPLLVYEKAITGLSTACAGTLEFDLYEASSLGKNAKIRAQVVDTATGTVLATGDYDATKSWVEHRMSFTGFSGSGITVRFYSLLNGSASGNDVCIDDILVSQLPCACVTYKMISENCVTTWYDSTGAVIAQPSLTGATRITCPTPSAISPPSGLSIVSPSCVNIGGSTVVTPTLTSNGGESVVYSISPADSDVSINPTTGAVTFAPTKEFAQ